MPRVDGTPPKVCSPFSSLPARCSCCFYGWFVVALVTCVSSFCTSWGTMILNTLTLARMYDEFAAHVRTAHLTVQSLPTLSPRPLPGPAASCRRPGWPCG